MAFPLALANLEGAILDGCATEEEWPDAIAHPEVAESLALDTAAGSDTMRRYETVIGRLAGFLRVKAPTDNRLPGANDEALVAGMVGIVGDNLRIGQHDRLEELRPELVLLTLLPYPGFVEAQKWADEVAK